MSLGVPKFRGSIFGSMMTYKITFWNTQVWSQCCVWEIRGDYNFHNLNCVWVVLYFGKWLYLVKSILYLCMFCRCNWKTEVGVYSESRCRSAPDYFLPTWSPQKQYFGVPHCGCRCRVWKSNVCLPGNRLWGNVFNMKCKLLSILNTLWSRLWLGKRDEPFKLNITFCGVSHCACWFSMAGLNV